MSVRLVLSLVLVFVSACNHDPDSVNGRKIAEENCTPCHDITAKAGVRHAPPLWGVYGRPLGSISSFHYSLDFQDQIKKNRFVWNKDNLERFLKNPREMFPNNRMSAWNPAIPIPLGDSNKDLETVRASLASAGHYETVDGFKNISDIQDIIAFLKTLKE